MYFGEEMIIKPHEQKFGIKAGPYPIITTPDDFVKYARNKKKDYEVELAGPIIPLADMVTGARVFDVDPKKKQFRPIGESKTRIKRIKDFREHNLTTYIVSINCVPKQGGTVVPPEGEYEMNTEVVFLAVPSPEYVFDRWTRDYESSANPITILVDSDKKLIAHFRRIKESGRPEG